MDKSTLEKNLKSLDVFVDSFKKGMQGELVDDKISILKEFFEIKDLLREKNFWVLDEKLTKAMASLEELEIQEQYLVKKIPPYYELAHSFSSNVKESLASLDKKHEEILEDFLNLSEEEQLKFLNEEKNQSEPVLEGFLPFLSKLPSDKQRLIIKELIESVEPREPFLSAIKENFEFAYVLSKKTNDPVLLFEILSRPEEALQKVIKQRVQNKSLDLPEPELFAYWGLLGLELKELLLETELTSIDRFHLIARPMSLHPREENLHLWSLIMKSPLWSEVLTYLKEDPVLIESCLEKWPSLFREKV